MPATTSVLSELHYEVRGSGPPVLFISGASGDAGHFTRAAERLAYEFTTVSYDRRGNSRSADLPPAESVSIAAEARDAAAVIEELGLSPAIVFGTSDGGTILCDLIARRSDVLRGAILHEPALVALLDETEAEDEEFERILELAEVDPRRAMEAMLRKYGSDRDFEALDPELRERMLGNGVHHFSRELPVFLSFDPDIAAIRRSGVRVRALASDDGPPQLIRATARFAEQLGLDVGTITGHHAPYLQQPEAFAEELRPILRELV